MNVYQQILTKYWGYPNFRPLQEEIIRSVADGNDTLALLPTGGGKSITFQVTALAQDGLCIVITPLIALMKDQVENLRQRKINAIAIYSGLTKPEIDIALNNCVYGKTKFLYLSPERLSTEIFLNRIQDMNINLIAVDEAHCISQWGYDFRPSYLKIADIRQILPNIPILAVTATATPNVVDDIQEKLVFRKKNVLQKSFERKNLTYLVRKTDDKLNHLLKIATNTKGSGIVYVRNRKKTREIAEFLQQNNITADYYHAGLDNQWRDFKQQQWMQGKCRIIVSTNAFGMGIDKANVRFVAHMDLPDSLEAYFQEAGRAGRDEERAYAVLLYNNADKSNIEKRIITSFPEIKLIKDVYQALCNYYQIPIGAAKGQTFNFRISDFVSRYKLSVLAVHNSLKVLQREGYIEFTEYVFIPSKVHFIIGRDDLYKYQVAHKGFDYFIKLLLRSYTGLFTDYVPINEDMLAKSAKTKIDVIYEYLQKLVDLNIIKYIPQRKNPMIVFIEERLDKKSLRISKENYNDRKKRYIERIEAVVEYASSNNKCRSKILLSYFGEKDPYRCGQCDICRKRNELDLSKYEFDIILNQIKKMLKQDAYILEKLVDTIAHVKLSTIGNEDKVLKVIQWLLENKKILYTDDKKLKWH